MKEEAQPRKPRAPRKPRRRRRNWGMTQYAAYLASPAWGEKRRAVVARDGHCQARGCTSTSRLQVHHRQYPKRLGDEPIEWLVTLCDTHHEALHRLRQQHGMWLAKATQIVLGEIDRERMEVRSGRPFHVVRLPDGGRRRDNTHRLTPRLPPRRVRLFPIR